MHIQSFNPQVFLSLILSLSRLAKAASAKAQESKETVITDRHIRMVAKASDTAEHAQTLMQI